MKRDLGIVRTLLLEAEKSGDRYFDIGAWAYADHDMREKELQSELSKEDLFHLDLLEQGKLIRKSLCEHSDQVVWEITWDGYEFLDAVRSETLWAKMQEEAKAQGISLTVKSAISYFSMFAKEVFEVAAAN
ncbi:uncharacterized protein DUF2513 [Pacificibacter maritimus]|uniref:Uncharacterized protein DUF2513 n=1 Tax=Pacificibacter maritimus TaxID=762213 RepID=A0A3N4U625_9RHOB|nr:DUF2513 domain-containing protein [Pacificibacter maritimus]RPE66226.1 uncharacterized protein DUF2513 [Pacificibacter maritimus]